MITQPIKIVVGGQYGSEAKGAVAAALCERFDIDYAVRTGAVNAGHTVYYKGKPYKMQQLPTGWVNPSTKLVIGPGAMVNEVILTDEIVRVAGASDNGYTVGRISIDPRAAIHDHHHTDRSSKSGRHHAMGATGKGCSEALIDRIRNRGTGIPTILGEERAKRYGTVVDTELLLNQAYDAGRSILLEGTQGQMLDLLLGPWPYTTHKPCGPAQWLVENGLSPNLKTEIVMVCRTYPIRVAGNSGPMKNEISWTNLTNKMNVKLRAAGHGPIISDLALEEWDKACAKVANVMKDVMPKYANGEPNWLLANWSQETREQFTYAASEFHKEVFRQVSLEVKANLLKLWESTTVTNKLRRIAEWDSSDVRNSIRQIRPDYMVLTFLNYWFPELWGKMERGALHNKAYSRIKEIEEETDCEVRYVTTGPESRHMIEVGG